MLYFCIPLIAYLLPLHHLLQGTMNTKEEIQRETTRVTLCTTYTSATNSSTFLLLNKFHVRATSVFNPRELNNSVPAIAERTTQLLQEKKLVENYEARTYHLIKQLQLLLL